MIRCMRFLSTENFLMPPTRCSAGALRRDMFKQIKKDPREPRLVIRLVRGREVDR